MSPNGKLESIIYWVVRFFIPVWIGLSSLIFISIILTTPNIKIFNLNFAEKGWEHLINVFKVPISFLGIGIPIYGIILTLYRSIQSEKQILLFRENVQFNNYYRHKDEFIKAMSEHFKSEFEWKKHSLSRIYILWLGNVYESNYKVKGHILNLLESYYEEIFRENVDIGKVKDIVSEVGFESKVHEDNIIRFLESKKDNYITDSIRFIEKTLEFTGQDIRRSDEAKEFISKMY